MKWLVAVLFVAFVSTGCASKQVVVAVDSTIYEVLSDVFATEQTALCGFPSCTGRAVVPTVSGWTLEKSQSLNKKLLPAFEAGLQFNRIIAVWNPKDPLPPQAKALTASLGDALTAVMMDFPDGAAKSKILALIGKAQAIVLSVLTALLS